MFWMNFFYMMKSVWVLFCVFCLIVYLFWKWREGRNEEKRVGCELRIKTSNNKENN